MPCMEALRRLELRFPYIAPYEEINMDDIKTSHRRDGTRIRMNINEAQETLSKRLWNTPWCVVSDKDRLILSTTASNVAIPKRKTRALRTWHGFPVVYRSNLQTKLW